MIVSVFLCLYLNATISAMQMGGFDIDVGNGENSSWQWQEEQWWNQSSWENTWENSWQTDSSTTENTTQNSHVQDNEYQYNNGTGNGTQDNMQDSTQPWNNNPQQNNIGGNGNTQWDNNSQQNNNFQGNNSIQGDNSQWNSQYQIDNNTQNNTQNISQTDNGLTVKRPEEISPTSTSTPIPTPKPAKHQKPTKTPKPTRIPTPKSVKKNKRTQNSTKKESKNAGDFKNSKNEDVQVYTGKYAHTKNEPVEFQCIQTPDNSHTPQIKIVSQGSVQILSVRFNGMECPWYWEEDKIILDIKKDAKINKIELLVISQGGRLIKMNS